MSISGRYVSLCLCVVSCTRVHFSYLLGFTCLKVKVVATAAAVSAVALASAADIHGSIDVIAALAYFSSTRAVIMCVVMLLLVYSGFKLQSIDLDGVIPGLLLQFTAPVSALGMNCTKSFFSTCTN